MKIKSISANKGIVYEYFVDENDKAELVSKLNLDSNLTDMLGEYLKGKEAIFHTSSTETYLMIDGTKFNAGMLSIKKEPNQGIEEEPKTITAPPKKYRKSNSNK